MRRSRLSTTSAPIHQRLAAGSAALVLLATAACTATPSVAEHHHGRAAQPSAKLDGHQDAPACRHSWLRISLRRDRVDADSHSTARDTLFVTTTHGCTMTGWPSFDHVPSTRQVASARPDFAVRRIGRARIVTVLPGHGVTSTLTMRVPAGWGWGGGNLCAGFTSAMVELPHVPQRYFVMNVPGPIVSCGGPAHQRFRVTVKPFSSTGGG